MATIFKNEINNDFIANVTRAAPWCGRTEPLESSPLFPAVTHNIHVIRAARISVLAKWTVLGVTCTTHDWPAASSSRYFGAWQNTPLPHPPTRSNWKCARACQYTLRHTAQSLEHMTLCSESPLPLALSVCLSVRPLLSVMQPSILHSSVTVAIALLQALLALLALPHHLSGASSWIIRES
jgi:hypothetical protein